MRVKLPNTWHDLTLGELQQYMLATTDVERLAALTQSTPEEIRKWSKQVTDMVTEHVAKLMANELYDFRKTFTMDGVQYGIVPDWGEFTLGEWIDISNAMEDFWKNAHVVMSILYRPVRWNIHSSYGIVEYTAKEDAKAFKQMPASYVSGAVLFFWSIEMKYLNTTPRSSAQAQVLSFLQSGDGITRYTSWLVKTCLPWTRLQKNQSK